VTDEDLRQLMHDLVRRTGQYGDMYWVAYLARFGKVSIYCGPRSRTRTMTREQALVECEQLIKQGGAI